MRKFLKASLVALSMAGATSTPDTAVVAGMQSLSDNTVATLGAVAPIAVPILGVFLVWKYGKRIFKGTAN